MITDEFDIFRDESADKKFTATGDSARSETILEPEIDEFDNIKPFIMVVDDDRDVREAINLTFKKKFNILLCASGEEGIEKINPYVFTVILDIKMEGKNGFETFTELKKKSPFVPIIFHSAYQDLKNPFEIMNDYRPFGYVVKEGEGKKLMHTIESAVDYYQQINRNATLLKQLQQKEEQYRSLVNNLNVGVYRNTGGEEGKFLQVNPALAKILGYDNVEDVLKKSVNELYENQEERGEFIRALKENGFCKNFEIKLKKKDGTSIYASVSAIIQTDSLGNIKWMDGILQDITEKKKAEEYLFKLNHTYQKFVPNQFLEFLGRSDITEIQLGDQTQREMSILFSDIRSFTTLSETMSSEENFKFINSFLKRIAPEIIKNNGFIDKYIGDAVMALFPDHANHAIDAAIGMLEEIAGYNEKRKVKGFFPITIGIGINTGLLTLGIVGDHNRMEGTVISDVVNLASRMEALTKMYGASILITEHTFMKTKDTKKYAYRSLDTVKVKGKNEPITVIEILNGNSPEMIDLKVSTKQDFEIGITLYQTREFTDAIQYFRKVLEKNEKDKAAEIYLKRSEYYEIHGVPPDWEAVETLNSK